MRDLISRKTIEGALSIGVVCTLVSLPCIYYHCFVGSRKELLEIFPPRVLPGVMLLHVWQILIVSFMCAAFGLAWSKKYGLRGIGDPKEVKRNLWKFLLVGILVATTSYLLFDRTLSIKAPSLYPSNPLWILSISLKASFFNEIVRFGMMALVARLTRNIHVANIVVSGFLVYIGIRSFRLVGLGFDWDHFSLLCVGYSFIFNLLMGYLYARFGIISTMLIQFLIGLRLLFL
ncbi:TPA: hypothetical protein DCX15_01235 [bacterium]|nr:hypothetical protein [bacterium]